LSSPVLTQIVGRTTIKVDEVVGKLALPIHITRPSAGNPWLVLLEIVVTVVETVDGVEELEVVPGERFTWVVDISVKNVPEIALYAQGEAVLA
jgi:hypothetical protein